MEIKRPLVSVISIFHNRAAEVEVSIESLLSQTYEPLEIIVVDDGSTDDTLERLKRFEDPRLTIVSQANKGFTTTLNATVKASRGEFVAIHGSGDISYPLRIERQAEVLSSHPEVMVAGVYVDNEGGRSRVYADFEPRPLTYLQTYHYSPMTHGEVMFRRSMFDRLGGYRSFFKFGQDHDLWCRIDRAGGAFWIVPELLYVRRRFAGVVNADPAKLMQQAFYADFAEQCAYGRAPDEPDLIDRYGAAAPFFAKRSKRLAQKLSGLGVEALARGEDAPARLLIAAARGQVVSPKTLLLSWIAGLSLAHPALWRGVAPVVRPLLGRGRKS
ncbi:glycosyltransferase family 2 protein [Caulobacter hibisci]|uniref:Glycosyltransferase n=1 Tax=Caulobacter hibisci TaxID=2035993 RepID=A0ABS0T5Q5_9CAUL|nr:glycosyltransferase [Caulobacter hibisci]